MLLFVYSMSQVIKAAEGTTIYQPFKEGLRTTNGITYKNSDALNYLNNEEYRRRYADYRNMNEKQRESFNTALNLYSEGIKNGKIDFTASGLTKVDSNIDTEFDQVVNDYFLLGVRGNLVTPYDESDKHLYKPNLKRIISTNVFDNENLDKDQLINIWNAFDEPDPTTGVRGIENRKQKYAEALRAEADKLENNPTYRSVYRYTGWQDDINAYKKTAAYLRQHADEIENLSDINSEGWYYNAAMANLTPEEVKLFFSDSSPLKEKLEEEKRKEQEQAAQDANSTSTGEANQNSNVLGLDPLSTEDITITLGDKTYTIDDNWQNLDNDQIKQTAEKLLSLFGRRKIEHNWTYWKGYQGYLHNLSNMFEKPGANGFFGIYAITKGPLSNSGKKFYIRTATQQYPVEVQLIKNGDGTYQAKDVKTGHTYNLGRYAEDAWTQADITLNDTADIGKPFSFDINIITSSPQAVRQYMMDALVKVPESNYPPLMFANMLMQLSYFFNKKVNISDTYELRLPNGTFFSIGRGEGRDSVSSFTWKNGSYGIVFKFKKGKWVHGKSKSGRDSIYLDPNAIDHIEIIRPVRRKLGGTITKMQYGGISDLVNFSEQNGTAVTYTTRQFTPKNKRKDDVTYMSDLSKKQKLASDKDFTVADGIRTAAAGLDLLSSLMIFPKGLNIASAVGTGVSFLGYITSDIIDVIQGRQDFGDVVKNDALMIGTMAVPMFINPQRAKALGLGQKAQRAAKTFSKFIGWGVAAGMIINDETRKSLENTVQKLSNGEITKLNSQDFTNVAFMLRMAGGVKEGVANRKYNKALKQNRIDNGKHYVEYSYKDGESVIEKQKFYIDENTDISVKSIKEKILADLNNGKPEEQKIKLEDITVPEAKSDSWINKQYNKYKSKFNKEEKPNEKEPQAKLEFEEGPETEMTPLYTKIFQKLELTKDGQTIRTNTALGKFIRETLKFDNFDVFFSDYNTVRNYRLGKINRLASGLYGALDELRAQGKELSEIIKSGGTQKEIDARLLSKMEDFGFLKNDPGVVEYAKRLADFYETDLAKYDNLQIAQMMYDADENIAKYLGKVQEGIEAKGINTRGLEYNKANNPKVTPEELQQAYEVFLKAKQAKPSESTPLTPLQKILQSPNRTAAEKKDLVRRVFSSFNTDAVEPIRMHQDEMIKLLLQTKSVQKALRSRTKTITRFAVTKGLEELIKEKQITQEQADRLSQSRGTKDLAYIIEDDYHGVRKLLYRNISVEELWNRLQTNSTIRQATETGQHITSEMYNNAINELIENKQLTNKQIENLRNERSDASILHEINNELNTKYLEQVSTFLNTQTAKDTLIKEFAQFLKDHTTRQWLEGAGESDLPSSSWATTNDLLSLPSANLETARWFIKNNPELMAILDDIFIKAREIALEPENPVVETPAVETPIVQVKPRRSLSSRIKNMFKGKNKETGESLTSISQERLQDIQEIIRENAEDLPKNQSVNKRLDQILTDMRLEEELTDEEYALLKKVHYNSLRKLIPKKYYGGNLEFVNQVLKMQGGNKFRGIQWTSGNQNWGSTVGPAAWNYIFDLLNEKGQFSELTGMGEKSLYSLGRMYNTLRKDYNENYAPNQYALRSDDVQKYQDTYNEALPGYVGAALDDLYSKGRYSRLGTQLTGSREENDPTLYTGNGFAAGTADLMGLGNVNYLTTEEIKQLLEVQKEKWKNGHLFYDINSGTIFPYEANGTPSNSKLLYDYLKDKENTQTNPTDTSSNQKVTDAAKNLFISQGLEYDEESGKFKVGDIQIGTDKINGVPINPLRILSVLTANTANIHANKVGESTSYAQQSNYTPSTQFRNLSKVAQADEEYGAYMTRKPTSDLREHEAFLQNIISAHHKTRQEGYDLNRTTYDETTKRAQENIAKDILNATNTYNTNLGNYTETLNKNRLAKAQQIVTNANNWKNFIDTVTTELAQFDKVKSQHVLTSRASMYQDDYNKAVAANRQNVYAQILQDLQDSPEELEEFKDTYVDYTTSFEESPWAKPYKQGLEALEQKERFTYYIRLEQLFNSTYDGRKYWHDIIYGYPKATWHGQLDYPALKEKTTQLNKKLGGRIMKAKKGGASINWLRVENARMLNKSIQNDIKHTYDSIKDANRELQKNIRAMAPLIKQLSKQERVKLK